MPKMIGPRLCVINIPKGLIFRGALSLVANYPLNSLQLLYCFVTIRISLRARILLLLYVMICQYKEAQNDVSYVVWHQYSKRFNLLWGFVYSVNNILCSTYRSFCLIAVPCMQIEV